MFIWNVRSCDVSNPGFTLVTGALWGKPMWGAFWVWDPRLTSVLLLFLLYLSLIALRSSMEDEALAAKLTAVLSLVGIGLGFTSRDSVRKRSLAGLIGIIVNFLALGIYALRVVASMMGGDN